MDTRERWSSRPGFVLAAIGSAVGLGNIWRFPYLVGVSGGGAFFVPYTLALLVCGLPVLMLELAGGRKYGGGVFATFGAVARPARWVGGLIALGALLLLSYYLVVTGWAAGYLAASLGGAFPSFAAFTAGFTPLLFFLLMAALTAGVVLLGVRRGVETANLLLVPLLFLMLVGLAVYGLSLPGWGEGVRFFLRPDPAALADPLVWVGAFGQVFFSLGVGMGVMVTYGSYVGAREPIAGSSLAIAVPDTLVALLAGLVVFPIVFSFGGQPGAGPQLAFDTLPLVFDRLPGATGRVLGPAFYLLLTIAALTSAVSLLETALVALREAAGVGRRLGLALLLPLLVALGLVSALGYTAADLRLLGRPTLDVLDELTGSLLLPLGVLATAVVLGWLTPIRAMACEVRPGFVGRSCLLLVRFATPAAIVAVLATAALQRLGVG